MKMCNNKYILLKTSIFEEISNEAILWNKTFIHNRKLASQEAKTYLLLQLLLKSIKLKRKKAMQNSNPIVRFTC